MRRDKRRAKKHRCQVCGVYGATQIHHIFGGPLRRISEKHDFVIELCTACHRRAHSDADFSFALKHDCQLEYLETHDMDEWMELLHRSWVYIREVREKKKGRQVPTEGPERFDDDY